jgi:glyoxylase-like metal-dependent hydrolase (beta-lactamase superfamily II)
MLEFRTEKVSPRITRIYGFCTELMYLVEGDEKAALLDTGSGFGSLRAAVAKLTNKPLVVLLTHGHVDHAMGAAEFDTVYMSRQDDYIFIPHGKEEFRMNGLKLAPQPLNLAEGEFIPTADLSSFHDLRDGDRFDLGGVSIEIYACPGHTRGSVVMLIREGGGFLLTGDACNTFTFMFQDYSLPISAYKENLLKLKPRLAGQFSHVLASHGDGVLPLDIIDGVIAVCGDIQTGAVDDIPFEFLGERGLIAKAAAPDGKRADGGCGNIVYNKSRVS